MYNPDHQVLVYRRSPFVWSELRTKLLPVAYTVDLINNSSQCSLKNKKIKTKLNILYYFKYHHFIKITNIQ